jgi:hypothetical protein
VVANVFVLVEFVIVPFATFIEEREIFDTDKLVIVALVIVELVTFSPVMLADKIFEVDELVVLALIVVRLEVPVAVIFVEFKFNELVVPKFPVVPLNVTAFDVVALLVDAFEVRKFDEDPNNDPM